MKKHVIATTLAGVLALATGIFAQAPAGGAAAPAGGAAPMPAAVKIGIINIQRAIVESDEGKKAAERLQGQFGPKRKELEGKQSEIERLQKQLRDQEKTLSDDAKSKLVRDVESKTREFNRTNEDATNEFQQAEANVINEIGSKVMRVIDDYARKNGFHMIMDVSSPQGPVLWASSAVDVTDEIIRLYNAAAPSMSSAPPAGAPVARPPAGTAPAAKPAPRPTAPATQPGTPAAPAAKKPAGQR